MSERYLSFPVWCREQFGKRLYRIPLDAGMTCPNRDGTLGTKGCIFCDAGGSGDFAVHYEGQQLQLDEVPYLSCRDAGERSYMFYFQAYTNTYAPIERLRFLYSAALQDPLSAGISIATRPDCMSSEVYRLLAELKKAFPDRFIWVELGLQTMHAQTAEYIRRGYPTSVFDDCVSKLHALGIDVIAHVILGLPGESDEMVYQTIDHLNAVKIDGAKLQLLHVLAGTDLAKEYQSGAFEVLCEEHYVKLVSGCIARLRKETVIHRLTGDGPGNLLIAPQWSRHKKRVLNEIRHVLKTEDIRQGCLCYDFHDE
ncbi:MAG: TIGR01212 family radical SAM protein [Stecheria intestinalis]|nr:TIGR01212 family radical SAM protein [Stecheria intestinalis]